MKNWENTDQDGPHINNPEGAIIFSGLPSGDLGEKQQLAAREILRMEGYLKGLLQLRKEYPDLPYAEAVVSATAKQIAEERGRFTLTYGTFPAELRVQ